MTLRSVLIRCLSSCPRRNAIRVKTESTPRRRDRDVDIPPMNRGDAAAARWIFLGNESRRRRDRDVDIFREIGAPQVREHEDRDSCGGLGDPSDERHVQQHLSSEERRLFRRDPLDGCRRNDDESCHRRQNDAAHRLLLVQPVPHFRLLRLYAAAVARLGRGQELRVSSSRLDVRVADHARAPRAHGSYLLGSYLCQETPRDHRNGLGYRGRCPSGVSVRIPFRSDVSVRGPLPYEHRDALCRDQNRVAAKPPLFELNRGDAATKTWIFRRVLGDISWRLWRCRDDVDIPFGVR